MSSNTQKKLAAIMFTHLVEYDEYKNRGDCEDNGYKWYVIEGEGSKCACLMRGTNIQGYDPIAKWINLGDNEGIKREFIDVICPTG